MLLIKIIKAITLTALFIYILYLMAVAKFDIVSQGEGVLAINDSNVNITSPSSGIIRYINISRGSAVKIGDKLLTIGNIEDENKQKLLNYNFDFYKDQVDQLSIELAKLRLTLSDGKPPVMDVNSYSTKLLKVDNRYKAYEQRKRELEDQKNSVADKVQGLKDQQKILAEKSNMIESSLGNTVRFLDSQLEVEKVKFQILESQSSLDEAKSQVDAAYIDFVQLVLDLTEQTEDELKKGKETFASTSSELNAVNERIQSTDIVSTVNGTVLSLKDGLADGVFIERNSEIMTLKREDDGIYIDARFDSKFRPYLAIGVPAKVKINAPGIKDYFYGHISGISVDSFDYDEYSKEGARYYNVKIIFDVKGQEIKKLSKLLGIKTNVFVINDQMTFIQYIFSTFNKDLDFSVW